MISENVFVYGIETIGESYAHLLLVARKLLSQLKVLLMFLIFLIGQLIDLGLQRLHLRILLR